jgi:hypothetical protein
MSELSPAAQAVLDATNQVYDQAATVAQGAAAALRAAAEIVAPLSYEEVWTDGRMLQYEKGDPVRNKLFAIADELKVQ